MAAPTRMAPRSDCCSTCSPVASTINRFVPVSVGQFAGAVIMFWVLGFIPGWILAKILAGANLLRIPKEVELLGLDFGSIQEAERARSEVHAAEQAEHASA